MKVSGTLEAMERDESIGNIGGNGKGMKVSGTLEAMEKG